MRFLYVTDFAVITIAVFSLFFSRNLFKKVVFLSIAQTGVIMLFLIGGVIIPNIKLDMFFSPFFRKDAEFFSDPVPQALMLTAIVVGFVTSALAIALVVRIKKSLGNITE